MKITDLEFKPAFDQYDAERARHYFDNGFGVSVVRGPYTYGGDKGLYELAILHGGELCYATDITDDVVGFLTPDEVNDYLLKIETLKENTECSHQRNDVR